MIENTLDGQNESDTHETRSIDFIPSKHRLVPFPKNTGKWLGKSWKQVKTDYLQRTCLCQNRTRLHCICNNDYAYCHSCFPKHISDLIG